MFSKFRIALGMSLLFAFAFVIPVFAGGWAVITLDEIPTDIVAGEPVTIGFTVMQHGETPMNDLTPTITANIHKDQEFTVTAVHDGKPGHYTATLTFSTEGKWDWSVHAFTMEQEMPALSVAAPVADVTNHPVAESEPVATSIPMLNIIRLSALGVGLIGLFFVFRRRSRFAMALTVVCLLVGIWSFVVAPTIPKVEAQSQSSSDAEIEVPSVLQAEVGQQLFVAKGCVTCHVNNKLELVSASGIVGGAPDLTNYSASPDALRSWLKDPVSVKPTTWMPNLHLSDAEIEALIAFINSD